MLRRPNLALERVEKLIRYVSSYPVSKSPENGGGYSPKDKSSESDDSKRKSKNKKVETAPADPKVVGGPEDSTIFPVPSAEDSGSHYVTDFAGEENEITKMVQQARDRLNLKTARFIRAPKDYYQQTLEWRRNILGAPDIRYLFKSMLYQNTRIRGQGLADPRNSEYYLIIYQYVTKFNNEKCQKFIRSLNGFSISKKKYNFRLAPAEASNKLSGFPHNAVSPLGIKTEGIPIVLSHRALELGHLWLGGGEEDLKLSIDTGEFRNMFRPYIADIVYDGFIDQENNMHSKPWWVEA